MDLKSLIQSFTKCSISFNEIFSCKLKSLELFTYVKSHVVLLVDHFKILAGSISPEILKKAPVTSPTHDNALEGWCICRQPTIVVFRAGLYRQPLFKGRLMRILKSPYMFVSM